VYSALINKHFNHGYQPPTEGSMALKLIITPANILTLLTGRVKYILADFSGSSPDSAHKTPPAARSEAA